MRRKADVGIWSVSQPIGASGRKATTDLEAIIIYVPDSNLVH